MKNYNGYTISLNSDSNCNWHCAFKENAKKIHGLKFSHSFRFAYTYGKKEYANGMINGHLAKIAEPRCGWGGENYYMHTGQDGRIILTTNLKDFFIMDNTVDYYHLIPFNFEN